MSNLSDIGFSATTDEEFIELIEKAYLHGEDRNKTELGTYSCYSDESGAELWIQIDNEGDLIGANPHYNGESRRTVYITNEVQVNGTELDGAYHAWAAPKEENSAEGAEYPFVFDLPDFRSDHMPEPPVTLQIQLAAFAHELSLFRDEAHYESNPDDTPRYATRSFIPTGLFHAAQNPSEPPSATAMFTGVILKAERKTNSMTGTPFYWMLVDTLGGEVDVVADTRFFESEPLAGGVIQGHFWLSGRLIRA